MADPRDSDSRDARATPRDGDPPEWSAHAARVAPLVDGVEYYRAVREAMIHARRQILIVGWEIHSEIDLLRGDEARRAKRESGWPVRLADLLRELVEDRPGLRVRLLVWEGASLFALERQHLPRMKRPWDQHERIDLVWDRDTPRMGSHHQKIVAVDDRVAFVGGMDLTKSRWDDHEHRVDEPRRRNPGLLPTYGHPYHDAMLCVDDDAARTLADWCRQRWRRATGETIDPPPDPDADTGDDPWPGSAEPILTDRTVRFVRTQPDHAGRTEIRTVEESFLEQIRAARKLIYIETQYLASGRVADALRERLEDPDGPEIVLILPFGCPGRIQSLAMDTRRDELLDGLRDADTHGRLGVFWATLDAGDTADVFERSVYIHAKVLVVDDRLLRIGSANLNRRSMGLDTELDACVLLGEDEDTRPIAAFRRSLLAYLLGVQAARVADAEREHGSVLGAIRALQGGRRTLADLDHRAPEAAHGLRPSIDLADPDRPLDDIDADKVMEMVAEQAGLGERVRKACNVLTGLARRHRAPAGLLLLIAGLVALWAFTPLGESLDRERVQTLADRLRDSPAGVAGVLLGFTLLASIGFPVTVLVAAAGATLSVPWALGVCVLGVAGSSLAGFVVGRRVGPSGLSGRIGSVAERLRGRGVLAVAIVRNMPVAPYAIVNAAFGVAGVSWRDYLAGTIIGMLPGIVMLAIFGERIGAFLADPTPAGVAAVLAIGAAIIGLALLAQRFLRRVDPAGRTERDDAAAPDGGR